MKRPSIGMAMLLVSSLGGGCSPADGSSPTASPLADSAYCEIAARDGEVSLRAGVATVCTPIEGEEIEGPPEDCRHQLVGRDGALSALELPGVRVALAVSDGSLVLSYADGRLVWRRAGGAEEELAAWGADPAIVGRRLAYLAAPADALLDEEGPAPGTPLEVVLHELGGTREVLATDPEAATPFPRPDGSGLIFVSTRTGVASVFAADRDGVRQLTNVGLEEVGQAFAPVPTGELVWLPGTAQAIYAARYEDDRIWMLDTSSGRTEELGPGRLPELDGQSVRIAVSRSGDPSCARRVRNGGEP